jgi:hypothetical protein
LKEVASIPIPEINRTLGEEVPSTSQNRLSGLPVDLGILLLMVKKESACSLAKSSINH